MTQTEIYDRALRAEQLEGAARSARVIVPLVLDVISEVNSVVDVGCGAGAWLAQFKESGVQRILGLDDGVIPEQGVLEIPSDEFRAADLEKELPVDGRFDLCICLELAQRLTQCCAPLLVRSLCALSDVVLFSAALPGQTDSSPPGQEAYTIAGRQADGWMEQDAWVRVNRGEQGKRLTLKVDVPEFLPFRYPLKLQAKTSGRPAQTLEVTRPGIYEIQIPLDHSGKVRLAADQWLVPAQLGLSSDTRQLCYRLVDALVDERTSPALGQRDQADVWMQQDVSVRRSRSEETKRLTLNVETPGWLPLCPSFTLQARGNGRPANAAHTMAAMQLGRSRYLNERWPSYWKSLFAAEGYRTFDLLRGRIWDDARIDWSYRQNLLLFTNTAGEARVRAAAQVVEPVDRTRTPLDIVHPECFYIFRSAADRLRGIIIEQAQLLGDAETEACFERAKMRELESAMALQATIIAEQAQLLAELEARSKSRRG